jgi:CheY-like chemotaxis protein
MRSLLIEDTRVGRTAALAILQPFGPVRVAASLDEARDILASGYDPDVVVTDLNFRDGTTWKDTMDVVVAMAKGRPIAAYTWQVWDGLPAQFASLYSGYRAVVLSKQNDNALRAWAQRQAGAQAVAEAGAPTDFGAEFSAYLEHLGAPKPGHEWVREIVRCVIGWQRRWDITKDTALKVIVTTFLVSALGWLALFIQWRGPE